MQELTDTQGQPDNRRLAIDRVGVSDLAYPVSVRDKAHAVQNTVATVTMAVDLPHHYKGTHMSRFIEALNAHGPVIDVRGIVDLPRSLRERLEAETAHAKFRFPFFLEKRAPVTGRKGLMDYFVTFEVNDSEASTDFVLTVEVPVTTLCPCSKAISARGAHNQRGIVSFSVRFREPIWIEDLIALVERSASAELFSVLKRPDEKAVTEAAYDNPVFVEDLVRNVAARAYAQDDIIWFKVDAKNYESIHNHNAYATIESRRWAG
ncbi:GTP cyclohydrolase FolE2 [soil metagenome]